jgi:hypothetical protein
MIAHLALPFGTTAALGCCCVNIHAELGEAVRVEHYATSGVPERAKYLGGVRASYRRSDVPFYLVF